MDVKQLIADQLGVDPVDLPDGATLESLGIDSLRALTILYAVEDATGIEVPNEALPGLRTVGDMLEVCK